MAKVVEVKNLQKAMQIVKTLRKEIDEEIIARGLDDTLTKELKKLKQDLLVLVNTGSKSKIKLQKDDKYEDVVIKKADKELIKYLTKVDLETVSKTRGYNTLIENQVSVVSSKRMKQAEIDRLNAKATSPMSSAVNVRIPMNESDTLQSHLDRATKYFNSALFVLVDENGRTRYYKNPGIDLSQYVKVVCSNTTGHSQRAQQVFDRHKTGERPNRSPSTRTPTDYADYSLLASGVQLIREKFVDLTEAVEKMKYGEYDEARDHIARNPNKNGSLDDVMTQVINYKKGKDLAPTTESYKNVVDMLRNLKLQKHTKKGRTYYALTTSIDPSIKDTAGFEERLNREVKLWKIDGQQKWVEALIKKRINAIKKLMR